VELQYVWHGYCQSIEILMVVLYSNNNIVLFPGLILNQIVNDYL
jgi:hypothetical protein